MSDKGILGDREKAMEANYFRQQDAKLIQKLREDASLDEIARAMRDKLQLDNPDLLQRVQTLGLTAETAAAILVAPLVQVAWAGGSVTREERETVLRLALDRGVEDGSPAQSQLQGWLEHRPEDDLFEIAIEVIKQGLAVLPPYERGKRIKRIIDACTEVAKATGGGIAWVIGIFDGITSSELSALDGINKALRREG